MPRKYNIGSKSDMRRFQRDIQKQAEKVVKSIKYDYQCACGRKFQVSIGTNRCPRCGQIITIQD